MITNKNASLRDRLNATRDLLLHFQVEAVKEADVRFEESDRVAYDLWMQEHDTLGLAITLIDLTLAL